MAKLGALKDRDIQSFKLNTNNDVARRVCDDEGNEILSDILAALQSTPVNKFAEITSVSSATETTIVTHTAAIGVETFLQRVSVDGTNIAEYQIKVNGTVVEKKRTYFGGPLSLDIEFTGSSNPGYVLAVGDIVSITVIHARPNVGDFSSRIQLVEV